MKQRGSSYQTILYRTFVLELYLPCEDDEQNEPIVCEYPSKGSVEQIKAQLFKTLPALFTLDRENFYLALLKENGEKLIISNEQCRFVRVTSFVMERFIQKQPIEVTLVRKSTISADLAVDTKQKGKSYQDPTLLQQTAPEVSLPRDLADVKSFYREGRHASVSAESSASASAIPTAPRGGDTERKGSSPKQNGLFVKSKSAGTRSRMQRRSTIVSYHRVGGSMKELPSRHSPRTEENSSTTPNVQRKKKDIVHKGYLIKQGGSYKNWKKRWFTMSPTFINYYSNSRQNTVPLGAILLSDIVTVTAESKGGKDNCFGIYTKHRTYYLVARNEKEMLAWIEAIKRNVQNLKSPQINIRAARHHSRTISLPLADLKKLYEGWLYVNENGSEKKSKWRRRWCAVVLDTIQLYRAPTCSKLLSSIQLELCNVEFSAVRKNCFVINNPQNDIKVLFAADTEREMREWMDVISLAINRDLTNSETVFGKDSLSPKPLFEQEEEEPVIDWSNRDIVVRKTLVPNADYHSLEQQVQVTKQLFELLRYIDDDPESQSFRDKMATLAGSARSDDLLLVNHVTEASVLDPPGSGLLSPLKMGQARPTEPERNYTNHEKIGVYFYFLNTGEEEESYSSSDSEDEYNMLSGVYTKNKFKKLEEDELENTSKWLDTDLPAEKEEPKELKNPEWVVNELPAKGKRERKYSISALKRERDEGELAVLSLSVLPSETVESIMEQIVKKYKRIYLRQADTSAATLNAKILACKREVEEQEKRERERDKEGHEEEEDDFELDKSKPWSSPFPPRGSLITALKTSSKNANNPGLDTTQNNTDETTQKQNNTQNNTSKIVKQRERGHVIVENGRKEWEKKEEEKQNTDNTEKQENKNKEQTEKETEQEEKEREQGDGEDEVNVNDIYVLQIKGRNEYVLSPNVRLDHLTYVKSCMTRKRKIEFVVNRRQSIVNNIEKRHQYYLRKRRAGLLDVYAEDDPIFKRKMGLVQEADKPPEILREECYNVSSLDDIEEKIKILSVTNFDSFISSNALLSVECCLYHGERQLGIFRTPQNHIPVWKKFNVFNTHLAFSDLPRETRVCFRLLAHQSKEEWCLGWAHLAIFDHIGNLRSGKQGINLWIGDNSNAMAPCVPNIISDHGFVLNVEFLKPPNGMPITYTFPSLYNTLTKEQQNPNHGHRQSKQEFIEKDLPILTKIFESDYLYELTNSEKKLLWKHRELCRREYPHSLGKVLTAVDWVDRNKAALAHQLLKKWEPLGPIDSISLLFMKYPDSWGRTFACNCLNNLSDKDFVCYIPQLIQACKYETYHSNALSQLLMRRALRSRLLVGQILFWELKVAVDVEQSRRDDVDNMVDFDDDVDEDTSRQCDQAMSLRYTLMAESYLRACSDQHYDQIFKQIVFNDKLRSLCDVLKKLPKNQRTQWLRMKLRSIPFPKHGLRLPLDSSLVVSDFIIDKCKCMESFTAPLWLVFKNKEVPGDDIKVIYKAGDDLRQDALTLQLIRFMDRLWKSEGLDMRMMPYNVVPTGLDEGFIEVVENSETAAKIQKEAGGAHAVWKENTIASWLEKNNSAGRFSQAQKNFIFSCAGYCVASYVLGIGDRHNDNIMISTTGHMFHIDFAHFLGNVLKFGPIVRDKAPFVLTPEMAFVMGGRDSRKFDYFIRLCCRAFNIVRRHGNVIISLFAMMLRSGIPQLSSKNDLQYLINVLMINTDEEEATKKFTNLIFKSLDTKTTQFNWAVHILANRGE
eukprot:CAMPEP_0174251648 /NCGR_PEP_ID=MMETSP0439-20130205/1398_1 /TAXON_ID=0 /ORGANISM="Stereomyxa ramosa, Strain Chinc5" /LENGTH=1738 /DNA_ID=CAMNT_0015332009 /DNA_START=91 /DNA_END=5307 /DNA_ORIENTATION=+